MASIVEATSLSRVTGVASNPPLHPNTPTDIPQLPLVLYIARVPGSRDVFLTPLKPREKVVSAEDIQSSLYYVHVNCIEDYERTSRRPSSANADASQLRPPQDRAIRRKPTESKRPTAPLTPPHVSTDWLCSTQPSLSLMKGARIERKPVGARHYHATSVEQQNFDLPVLPRRPLPSPPAEETLDDRSLHASNVQLLHRAEHSQKINPYDRYCDPAPAPLDPAKMPEPGTLTLIRRDPSTNEQWDVAFIHDPPVHEVSSAALLNPNVANRTKRGGAPLYLDVSNASYAKFINQDRSDSRISSSSSASSDSDPAPEGIFRRRLYMPGSRFSEHSYRQHRKSSSRASLASNEDDVKRKTMRKSQDLSSSIDSAGTSRSSGCYTFTSPWDGHCEFATGATGKTLKCRHYLPVHQQPAVRELSELRFNLPTSTSRSATALAEKRSSYFHRMNGRSESESEPPVFIFGDDGKLDLTLGQEHAGGGFGGKQAKLGKLIIQPEGMKMLDLLVAANIGLWWRAYERV